MRALSIRQPYAEQILRHERKVEHRTIPTKIRERVYLYASRTVTRDEKKEFEKMKAQPGDFPTGVLVGTVEVVGCTDLAKDFQWHLARPKRLRRKLRPTNHPQQIWFYPFKE